jgi:hypothetical protein
MNNKDNFEKRLRRQAQRPVPAAWRQEILAAARESASPCRSAFVTHFSLLSALQWRLTAWLWPHPTAWACLAAVWFVVFSLNFISREPARPDVARKAAPPSPQMREMLQQQERLFAELAGPFDKSEITTPKPVAPQPRSQRRMDFLNA